MSVKKYAVSLAEDGSQVESVKEALAAQGARNIEVHGMGLLTVDSEVPINFAAIVGIEGSQEIQETEPLNS